MIAHQADHESDFSTYVRLLLRLHELIAVGKGDDEVADEVRDQMDGPWRYLTPAEIALIDGLSADLYSIGVDRPSGALDTNGSATEEFKGAVARNDWPAVLEIVRSGEADEDPFVVAYIRGVCWAHLSQPDVAVAFFREAQRIRPLLPAEECWLLTSLIVAKRSAEAIERSHSILESGSDPLLMLKAAEVLSVRAAELDEPERQGMRQAAIDAAQRALTQAETSPPDELLTTLRIGVLRHLAINLAECGDITNARLACEAALELEPGNFDTAMLSGWLHDRPQAPLVAHDIRRELPRWDASQLRQSSALTSFAFCDN